MMLKIAVLSANAQREGEYGHQRHRWTLLQHADRITEIQAHMRHSSCHVNCNPLGHAGCIRRLR